MLPIVGIPDTVRQGMAPYREVFCRAEGFDHVSRYVTGLILSPHKTLQGIYDAQVWEGGAPSRRAMHTLSQASVGVPRTNGDGGGARAPAGGRRPVPRGTLCL